MGSLQYALTRLRPLAVGLGVGLALALAAGACGDDDGAPAQRQERRRVALQPVDVAKKKAEKRAAEALYDKDMRLLPSDEIVAGLRLPRGLTPKLEVENRHYFHTKVPLEKLREYLGPKLATLQVVPDGKRTYKYVKAKTQDGEQPHTVNVRVGPSSESIYINEIMVQDLSLAPITKVQSFERSQAQLKALREHAQ